MGENVCCPYLFVLDCGDTPDHKHLACQGSIDDGPGLDNEKAAQWCLGFFEHCPSWPRGE